MTQIEKEDKSEYTFIKERVLPRRKQKLKKIGLTVFFTMMLAVLFGVVSRIVFETSEPFVIGLLGEKKKSTFIEQKEEIAYPSYNREWWIEESRKEDEIDQYEENQDAVLKEEAQTQSVSTTYYVEKRVIANLDDYVTINRELSKIVNQASDSLVTVTSKKEGVNWYDSPYQIETRDSGLVIKKGIKKIMILVSLEHVQDADSIEVGFPNSYITEGSLANYDEERNLAIVSVPVDNIPQYILDRIVEANMNASFEVDNGTPILAVGSPNGVPNSMDYGIVTNCSQEISTCDMNLEIAYSNMRFGKNASGFILNVGGEVIGMIYKDTSIGNDNYGTYVQLSSIENLVEKLVNKDERTYLGVIAENMTARELEDAGITSGIYIKEVLTDSPAYDAGIQSGDIILSINEIGISNVNGLVDILEHSEPKNENVIVIKRFLADEPKELEYTVSFGKKTH